MDIANRLVKWFLLASLDCFLNKFVKRILRIILKFWIVVKDFSENKQMLVHELLSELLVVLDFFYFFLRNWKCNSQNWFVSKQGLISSLIPKIPRYSSKVLHLFFEKIFQKFSRKYNRRNEYAWKGVKEMQYLSKCFPWLICFQNVVFLQIVKAIVIFRNLCGKSKMPLLIFQFKKCDIGRSSGDFFTNFFLNWRNISGIFFWNPFRD